MSKHQLPESHSGWPLPIDPSTPIPSHRPNNPILKAATPSVVTKISERPLEARSQTNLSIAKGEDKKEPTLHFYPREIAKTLNPKQPDVAGAVILFSLSLWQANSYKQTLINGKRHSFRSLTNLEKDHPYFTREAIHKTLKRMEEKLGDEFHIHRDKKVLHFSIGEKTLKLLKKAKVKPKRQEDFNIMNSFYVDDAVKTGDVRSAVLLQNLKHALSHFIDPKRDFHGNRYAQMSPKKLSAILNYSEDTISRLLSQMCSKGHMIRHPDGSPFYSIPEGFIGSEKAPKAENGPPAEVHSKTAEVHTRPAEIHSQPAEVHSEQHSKALEPLKNKGFNDDAKVTCINECINGCGTECIKDRDMAFAATPKCQASQTSKGSVFLSALAEAILAKMRSIKAKLKAHSWTICSDLHYEHYADIYELPYEIVSDQEHDRHANIEESVKITKDEFRHRKMKVDKNDIEKIRQFFRDNPQADSYILVDIINVMINGPLTFKDMGAPIGSPKGILTKVKTAKAFLKYMPQIIEMLFGDNESFWEVCEPYDDLNFAYLGKVPQSAILDFGPAEIRKIYIE